MEINSQNRESVVKLIATRPSHLLTGMINVQDSPTFSGVKPLSHGEHTCGAFDELPLEALHTILMMLDVLSLSRMARTCHRALEVVESVPQYRDLMSLASNALAAMGRTRTLGLHSVSTLHEVLKTEECISCGRFGAFLFLPSCSRCCYACLSNNQNLWVVSVNHASKAFGLARQAVKTLPIMRGLPGSYWAQEPEYRPFSCQLVSVRAALQLAEQTKSREQMIARLNSIERKRPDKDYYYLRWLLRACPLSPGYDFPFAAPEFCPSDYLYSGMASVAFPSLGPKGVLNEGLWCKGCFFERANDISRDATELWAMGTMAWSIEGFWEHIQLCTGVERLAAEPQLLQPYDDLMKPWP